MSDLHQAFLDTANEQGLAGMLVVAILRDGRTKMFHCGGSREATERLETMSNAIKCAEPSEGKA